MLKQDSTIDMAYFFYFFWEWFDWMDSYDNGIKENYNK